LPEFWELGRSTLSILNRPDMLTSSTKSASDGDGELIEAIWEHLGIDIEEGLDRLFAASFQDDEGNYGHSQRVWDRGIRHVLPLARFR